MNFRNDEEHSRGHGPSSPVSPRGRLVRGIAVGAALGTLVTVPWELLRPLVPENLGTAMGNLLLGVNMFVGYMGGRTAARAGLAHDDGRGQWTMATTVALAMLLVQLATARLRTGTLHVGAPVMLGLAFAARVLLMRFGYAMGTWSQARREGRVQDDEDEASAD